MLATHYIDLAKTPISPADFCGDEVRYSVEFERLEAELAKGDSLHANAGPDWNKVREGSERVLRQHSKDLRAAVWLTWSLYQGESFSGLQAGIAALLYLCTEHWQDLHPRKARTRQAAFGWLLPRIEQTVASQAVGLPSADFAIITTLADQLRQLDQCLTSQMSADAPLLLPLCRRLDELTEHGTADHSKPTSTSEQVPIEARMHAIHRQTTDTTAVIDTARGAHKAMRAIQEQARSLCAWWLEQSATDSRAIRLSRTLLWLPIDTLPEHDARQQTSLRGLPANRLAAYAERFGQGQYRELLRELEASVARSPFWLDGQRMVWECLEALGAEDAQHELEAQTRSFLARLTGLEQLRFHDGVPFADDCTQAWLAASAAAAADSPGAPAANNQECGSAPWEDALNTATTLMRKENLKAAVTLLKQGMQAASNARDRFHWQLAQARLCHQGKHYELAAYQLEALHQTLHDARLDRWEPDLAIGVLQLLADSYQRLPRKHAAPERRNEIYQRLCHLDLEAALDQTPGS